MERKLDRLVDDIQLLLKPEMYRRRQINLIGQLQGEGLNQWSVKGHWDAIENMSKSSMRLTVIREALGLRGDPRKESQKRVKFLDTLLPQLSSIHTPEDEEFYSVDSPRKLVRRVPASKILFFGTTHRGTARWDSDIDLLVVFPIVIRNKKEKSIEELFDHARIGYKLRRDFASQWSQEHGGKSLPYRIDLMPFPDSTYIELYGEYSKRRGIWNSAHSEGKMVFER